MAEKRFVMELLMGLAGVKRFSLCKKRKRDGDSCESSRQRFRSPVVAQRVCGPYRVKQTKGIFAGSKDREYLGDLEPYPMFSTYRSPEK